MPRSHGMPDERVRLVAEPHTLNSLGRPSAHCGSAADCGQDPQPPQRYARKS
jgi:hypothetical protein